MSFIWLALWPAVVAADGDSIDRTLRREPTYLAKPHYCLLLLGPQGKTRVWLVAAGEAFYADTSGVGDLAQPSKRIYSIGNYRSLIYLDPGIHHMWFPVPEHVRVYNVGDVFEPISRTWYHLTVHRLGKLDKAEFQILVDTREQFRQLGKLSRFGDHAKDAPVLHFGGPLTLGLFTTQLVPGAEPNKLEAWVGTKEPSGTEGKPTYLVIDDWIPSGISPAAGVELPPSKSSSKPVRSQVQLSHRERLMRFSGTCPVHKDVGPGIAKITLTIPGWRDRAVQPATVEIPVVHVVAR